MSLFHKLVSSAIESGSTTAITRDLKEVYILDDEKLLYDFIHTHVTQHKALPSVNTLENRGFNIGTHEEPVSYYLDRIRQRFVYNVINSNHPDLRDALSKRDSYAALEIIRQMLNNASVAADNDGATNLRVEMDTLLQELSRRKFMSGLAGVTFGWDSLDQMTLGAMGGDLTVIAARPSTGKSWLLNEMAFQAWRAQHSVMIVTMEMSKQQVTRRWVGRHLGVNPNFIRSGQVSTYVENQMHQYRDAISAMPNWWVISGDMKKGISSIEQAIVDNLPDIIYIDAAYLLSPSVKNKGSISKWEAISAVVSELKQLAIKYDRPIVITVQFNRNAKNSSSKQVYLSDIGGSDSIPQDASIVLGVKQGLPPFEDSRRTIQVMKNREGDTGTIVTDFSFNPPSMVEVSQESEDNNSAVGWME